MAKAPKQPSGTSAPAPPQHLSTEAMEIAADRLKKRLEELRAFDINQVTKESSPELSALSAGIASALGKAFGDDTAEYRRYSGATELIWRPYFGGSETPVADYRKNIKTRIERAEALITQAVAGLLEDIAELDKRGTKEATPIDASEKPHGRKVFLVHGHNDGLRHAVARFLEKIGFESIVLHEQASRGATIIEKIEANRDVGFAVVLLSEDDVGGKSKESLRPRARQNVILELGYFLALLDRDRVCAIKQGDVETPSDFDGVVYLSYDEAGAWKAPLVKELIAAGYAVDWNKAMNA